MLIGDFGVVLIGDFGAACEAVLMSTNGDGEPYLASCSCSSSSNTCDIGGRSLASPQMHCKAMLAMAFAPFFGYCPPSFVSMIRYSLRLSPK